MSLLTVDKVTHGYGERIILKDATFRLLKGEHIGLIGANGEGKTTFFNIILGNTLPESGKVTWAKHLHIGYLDQMSSIKEGLSVKEFLQTAFNDMYKMEEDINNLYINMASMTEEEMNNALEEIGEMQSILDASGFYLIDKRIEEVSNGLGIKSDMLNKEACTLSGGERAKVLLIKLLLENPGILLLDEPTNFLDSNHIAYLKNFLINYEYAFIVISHDEAFLNDVVNVVYHLDNGILTRYSGNLDFFKQAYLVKVNQINAAYKEQQREIAKMEDFIARNKARVATRSMANSRQKMLDKMEIVEKVKERIKPSFSFNYSIATGKVLFRIEDLVIGYDKPLTIPISFEILRETVVIVRGINGVGKSTFIKTILGLINSISGKVTRSPALEINYYKQEEESSRKTPFEEIRDTYPNLNNGEIHYFLSAAGLSPSNIESQMITLSGGEAARVRLCKLMIKKCNCLVLDEPTNHLDDLAKSSLAEAITSFTGCVILVCHEDAFIESIKSQEKSSVQIINLEDYRL